MLCDPHCLATIMCLGGKYRAEGVMTITAPNGAAPGGPVVFSHCSAVYDPHQTIEHCQALSAEVMRPENLLPHQHIIAGQGAVICETVVGGQLLPVLLAALRNDGLAHGRSDLAPFLHELNRMLLVINSFPASTIVRNR